jgi:hypothetical protein
MLEACGASASRERGTAVQLSVAFLPRETHLKVVGHTALFWVMFRTQQRTGPATHGCPLRVWWNGGPGVGEALLHAAVPAETEDDAKRLVLRYWSDANIRFCAKYASHEKPWTRVGGLHVMTMP